MEGTNWWDVGLLVAAGYLAVVGLLRLMLAYREAKISELKRLFEEHQRAAQDKTNARAKTNTSTHAAEGADASRKRPAA